MNLEDQYGYEATVSYDATRIGMIDRNLKRIAGYFDGRQVTDHTIFTSGACSRKLSYTFATKLKRRRFIQEMRRFIKDSDFGVTVRVGEVKA